MRTRYTVKHGQREWTVEDPDVAQYWKTKGATVKAETMNPDYAGIQLTRLTDSELDNLLVLAEDMDWNHVAYMVREEAQQRVEA